MALSQESVLPYWDFLKTVHLCRSKECLARAPRVVFNEMTAEGPLTSLTPEGVYLRRGLNESTHVNSPPLFNAFYGLITDLL